MIRRMSRSFLAVLGCTLLLSSQAAVFAGEFNQRLDVGDASPAWSELEGIDGQRHRLADLKDVPAVVVVFLSVNCPIALSYEQRLNALAKEFDSDKMTIVAISSNNDETLAMMKRRAEEKSYAFQYLRDADQQLATDFGATCTPHAFLLDEDRKIVYMGAIDDNKVATKVTRHYLHDAIKNLLAGSEIAESETRQFGCGIQWIP